MKNEQYKIKLLCYENGQEYEDELINSKIYRDKDEAFLDAVSMAEEELELLEKENPMVTYEIPDNASFSNGKKVSITEKCINQKKACNVIVYMIAAI